MADEIGSWFDNLPQAHKKLLEPLRQTILSADDEVREELKWGQPCYSVNKLLCYLQKAKEHVTIGFQQGANLDDPDNLLSGEGKSMRHIKFPLTANLDKRAITKLIKKAIEHDRTCAP